ncbi:MAG: SIR2 family protein [Acetobacter sp.]|nr:SIR2 family protein [Acetobacter sp.]
MTKRIFFLGAGFSKAIDEDYPLMEGLTQNIGIMLEKESVAKHYEEIAPLTKGNVESLLTYLATDFPWKSDVTKFSNHALYAAIIEKISEEFKRLIKEYKGINNPVWNQFSSFVKKNWEDCNFITLNYDILLEQLLLKNFIEKENDKYSIFNGFYRYPIAYIGERDNSAFLGEAKDKVPAILKLHGSANWFWAGMTPSDVLYYRMWENDESETALQGLKPYIIPPVMDKNAFYNHIAIHSLWKRAEQLLKDAEEIYIIGFSFPQTDLSVKYLFQSALRDSTAPIYVINPEQEKTLRINYDKVFGNKSNVIYEYVGKKKKDPNVTERFIKEHLLLQRESAE